MKLKMLGALVGLVCLSQGITNDAKAQGCYGRGGGYISAQVVLPPIPVPVPVAPVYGYGAGYRPRPRAWRQPRYYNNCAPAYGYRNNGGYRRNRGYNRGYSYNNGYNNGGRRNGGYNNGYRNRGNRTYHYSR